MRPRAAFTLVEVLAGLLLFSLGVMGVVGVILYGMRSAAMAQSDATAWGTAVTVLKDPLPQGGTFDADAGRLVPWAWSVAGSTWTADDGSSLPAWEAVTWDPSGGDVVCPDMGDPQPMTNALSPGMARGWLNGYYVERREQSLANDRIANGLRLVEVRVDVYLAAYNNSSRQPVATAVDRVVRNGGL